MPLAQSSEHEVVQLVRDAKFPVFVCGAGISYGAAPLAQQVEDGLLSAVAALAFRSADLNSIYDVFRGFSEVRNEYFTLEMLASAISYRIPSISQSILDSYREIFSLPEINRANKAISNAFTLGFPKIVLTSNFDDGLFRSLSDSGGNYRVITDANANGKEPTPGDICAYHGTIYNNIATKDGISNPSTMTARELAHPFLPSMADYIERVFEAADRVIFIGHRGEDFYDMNLLVKKYIGDSDSKLYAQRKGKFFCIPHCGKSESVSTFYFDVFDANNILDIGRNQNWVADICDQLSGGKTETTRSRHVDAKGVEFIFRRNIEKYIGNNKRRARIASRQASSLIDDIIGSVFAVWSITEHYRLESLALTQREISYFGRPPRELMFHGIAVGDFLDCQRLYQDFRSKIDPVKNIDKSYIDVAKEGVELFTRLESLSKQCMITSHAIKRGIERAFCILLQAIALDYMGLIAMRFESKREYMVQAIDNYDDFCISSSLFKNSWECADKAGSALEEDESLVLLSKKERRLYLNALEEVVSWRTWRMAPRENFARSPDLTLVERIEVLKECIDERMSFINRELNGPKDEINYSIVGFSALCALRCAELMRVLAFERPVERGIPDFSKSKHIPNRRRLIDKIEEYSRICINVGKQFSSQKNIRFMSAYDALILCSLYSKRESRILTGIFFEAKEYAGTDKAFLERIDQISTRIKDQFGERRSASD